MQKASYYPATRDSVRGAHLPTVPHGWSLASTQPALAPRYGAWALLLLAVVAPPNCAGQDLDQAGTVGGCPVGSPATRVCYTTYQAGNSRRGYNPYEASITQASLSSATGPNFYQL